MAKLTKKEVMVRFCGLSAKVARDIFKGNYPYDCFCEQDESLNEEDFQFEDSIVEYIEDAVNFYKVNS